MSIDTAICRVITASSRDSPICFGKRGGIGRGQSAGLGKLEFPDLHVRAVRLRKHQRLPRCGLRLPSQCLKRRIRVLFVPFKGDGLKGILTGRLFEFSFFRRVDAVLNILSGCRGTFLRFLQGGSRVQFQRNQFFPSLKTVFEPLCFRPAGSNQQKKSISVK